MTNRELVTMPADELQCIVVTAIDKFNMKEKQLMESNLSERCICSRFALYLAQSQKLKGRNGFGVYVEYNRGFDNTAARIKELHGKRIFPDLIVTRIHKKSGGVLYDNLICIEMKKEGNRQGFNSDCTRLAAMVDPGGSYKYHYGCMVVIGNDNQLRIERSFK